MSGEKKYNKCIVAERTLISVYGNEDIFEKNTPLDREYEELEESNESISSVACILSGIDIEMRKREHEYMENYIKNNYSSIEEFESKAKEQAKKLVEELNKGHVDTNPEEYKELKMALTLGMKNKKYNSKNQ